MLHHKLPAEPNCSHSTRQSIHSRQLKSNFHSIRLAPDCELGERGRRATFSWPKPHATEAERPCAYDAVRARPLCTDRSAALRPQWLSSARARSPELGAAGGHGSNKGLTGRSVQEGTAVEVQRPSGARAMGYSFIRSYQKKNVLTFKPPSETRDRTHPYTGEMGLCPSPSRARRVQSRRPCTNVQKHQWLLRIHSGSGPRHRGTHHRNFSVGPSKNARREALLCGDEPGSCSRRWRRRRRRNRRLGGLRRRLGARDACGRIR